MNLDWYVEWVGRDPLVSAAIQFAILGTLGEILSHLVKTRRVELPCGFGCLVLKMVAWAGLGIFVKYGFVGVTSAVEGLHDHGMLPELVKTGIPHAAVLSVTLNVFFGPVLMVVHRILDNLIARRWDFSGMKPAFLTLAWFWVPAQILTFSLPPIYRIGLAAAWALVLGIILGATSPASRK